MTGRVAPSAGSASTTATPCRASSPTSRTRSATISGARPVIISSSSSTRGSAHQGPGHHEHLLLAATEHTDQAPDRVRRIGNRSIASSTAARGQPQQLGHHLEVVAHRSAAGTAAAPAARARCPRGPGAGREAATRPAADPDRPGRGDRAVRAQQQAALAGAVRADQRGDLPGRGVRSTTGQALLRRSGRVRALDLEATRQPARRSSIGSHHRSRPPASPGWPGTPRGSPSKTARPRSSSMMRSTSPATRSTLWSTRITAWPRRCTVRITSTIPATPARVGAGERLVEQHHHRVLGQRPADLDQPLLARGVRSPASRSSRGRPRSSARSLDGRGRRPRGRAGPRRARSSTTSCHGCACGRAAGRAEFSRTVSSSASCGYWNVRASPARARRAAGPASRLPRSVERLRRSAACAPEIRSTSVVLPAPFGPTRPRISPAREVSETSSSATTPP